jgi:hypothetical protein
MTPFVRCTEQIMKLKYIVMLLTCLGFATVAGVYAQQDIRPREPAKTPFDEPDPQNVQKSADAHQGNPDAVPTTAEADPLKRTAAYLNDAQPDAPMQSLYRVEAAWFGASDGRQQQLAQAESALSQKADELKKMLERAKDDAGRAEIRTKLSRTLADQFDLRQRRHNQEIDALERQVAKLKELVRKRQESRSEIITRRVEQIQREADGLGW